MDKQFSRTGMLVGEDGIEKLRCARVAVFGIGGVGGYAAEALVRSGVGHIDLIDSDTVNESNLNRQIIALHSTVGQYKVDAARERFLDISPDLDVRTYKIFYTPETSEMFDFKKYDFVVDAIDSVTGKIELVMQADRCCTPIISSMGTGNKMHPELLELADIYKTSVCPLARVMRTELKKRGIRHLKVVYSKETPIKPVCSADDEQKRRSTPGSTSFVPSAAGLIIASAVVNDILIGSR